MSSLSRINIGFNERSSLIKRIWLRCAKGGFSPRYWWYRLRWNLFPIFHIITRFPLHINIEATNECNLNCVHCYRRTRDVKVGHLDFFKIKKYIDESKTYSLPSIMVSYGGEFFKHKDAEKILEYASKNSPFLELSIVTNATLMTKEVTDKIFETNLTQIIISMDAFTKKTYESIRIGADYDRTMDNIHYFLDKKMVLKRKKPLVRIQMVGMSLNKDEIDDFIEYWTPKVDMVTVNEYLRYEPDSKDYSISKKYSDSLRVKSCLPCSQLWQRIAVNANNEIVLCNNDYNLGAAGERSLYDWWHSDEVNKIRDMHLKGRQDELPKCANCPFRY